MPRIKKIEDTEILTKILEVIKEMGTTEFSLEDLRKATGLSPATLLQRFGSKKNILYKSIELANVQLKNNLIKSRSINKSNIKTRSYIDEIIKIYLELGAAFSSPKDVAGGLDILKLDINDKKLNTLTRRYFATRREKIESLLTLAQNNKELSTHIVSSELVWNLESLWQGSIMLWALTGKGPINKWLIQRFKSFFSVISFQK